MEIVEETPYRFRIDPRDGMRVPGIAFVSRALLPDSGADKWLDKDPLQTPHQTRSAVSIRYRKPSGATASRSVESPRRLWTKAVWCRREA